jgi:hypothetical protein
VQSINSAIADIQLFGSEEQIDLAIKIAMIMSSTKGVPTQDLVALLQHLRSDLRLELDLPPITKGMVHLNVNLETRNKVTA